jgi:hypothetical protein
MWVWWAVVMLLTVGYVIPLIRNKIADKQDSKVTWRNFVLPVIITLHFVFWALFVANLDRSNMKWPEVIIPFVVAEFVTFFLTLKSAFPGKIRREMREVLETHDDPPEWMVLCKSLHLWVTSLFRILLAVLLAEKANGSLSGSWYAVITPVYIYAFTGLVAQWADLNFLIKAGMMEPGQRCSNYFTYILVVALNLTAVLLTANKIEVHNANTAARMNATMYNQTAPQVSERSLATCLIPLWLQLAAAMIASCCALTALCAVLRNDAEMMSDLEKPHEEREDGMNGEREATTGA